MSSGLGLRALLLLIATAGSAAAQSNPGWTLGQVPTPQQWNDQFGLKMDVANPVATGILSVPSIVAPLTVFTPVTGLGALTVGAGSTNHIVLSAQAFGSAPLITGTGTDGLRIDAGNGTVGVTSPFSTTPGTITWSGSLSTLSAITTTQVHNGTSTINPSLNRFLLTDNISTTPNTGHSSGISALYNFGASTGGKLGLDVQAVQVAANTDSGADNYYTGGRSMMFGRFSQPGSSPTNPLGRIFGFNAFGSIQGGFVATNLYQVAGAEFNVGISAGSSASIRSGVTIADLAGTAQGFNEDAMLWLYGAGQPWRYAIMFGGSQPWPMDATDGTMIGANIAGGYAARPMQTKWGIDLSQVIFPATGNPYDGGFFRTRGASLDGAGTLQLGTTYLTSSAAGLSIDAKGSVGTGAAIATAGSGYSPVGASAEAVTTAFGGKWLVTTNGSGVPISVAVLTQPTLSSTTPPGNPVATINLNRASQGTGLTLTLTWNTTATALSLQPTAGGKIGLYNAVPVARSAGYAAMTGAANKAAVYDTTTVTLPQLAGRVMQLQADLIALGAVGP